jgi:hypothetical protein
MAGPERTALFRRSSGPEAYVNVEFQSNAKEAAESAAVA